MASSTVILFYGFKASNLYSRSSRTSSYPSLKIRSKVHAGNISKFEFLNIFGQFQLVSQIFALIDDFLAAEEVGQLNDIVDVVAIFNIVGFVDHPDVVEDVVLSDNELEEDDPDWPYVRLIRLL